MVTCFFGSVPAYFCILVPCGSIDYFFCISSLGLDILFYQEPGIRVGTMIWDNFSIFRTNCAIACGTRAYMLRGFLRMSRRGKWRPKFPKSFILLAHYSTRLCLLEFCLSISVVRCPSLSEVRQCMSCFISLTRLCSAASFTRISHYSTLNFTYVED